jgi:ABC-type transport system involved in cytochrome c biogenesis permease subunit
VGDGRRKPSEYLTMRVVLRWGFSTLYKWSDAVTAISVWFNFLFFRVLFVKFHSRILHETR